MNPKFNTVIFVLTASLFASSAHANSAKELADWATAANQKSISPGYLAQSHQDSASQNPYQQLSNPLRQASYSPATSQPQQRERYPVGEPTFSCVIDAAKRQRVPVDVLLAVNSVERGATGQYVGNTNGTQDIGSFQINSIHLPRAKEFQATSEDLATRGCYNAEFAALLLHEAINHPKMQSKDQYTRAAGYHSWTPKYNTIYKKKLVKYLGEWRVWLKQEKLSHLVSSSF